MIIPDVIPDKPKKIKDWKKELKKKSKYNGKIYCFGKEINVNWTSDSLILIIKFLLNENERLKREIKKLDVL